MSENPVAVASNRDLATMPLDQAIAAYDFRAALPPNVSADHFRRMLLTAVSTNPDLAHADRRTLFNAAVRCAADGLVPDGREAALVVYRKTKVKGPDGRDRWIDAVSYMPMVAGLRKRMRNSGEVASAVAYLVHRNDKFSYRLGEDQVIEHVPAALEQERGEPIGAYAIIKLTSGETIREVMSRREIEGVRGVSRSKDGPAWSDWWGEMARKTVLRRAAKAVPQDAALARMLERDDEPVAMPPAESLPLVPPRPEREEFDDLPAHVTTPEMRDEETGEVGAVEDDPTWRISAAKAQAQMHVHEAPAPERDPFWSQPKLLIPETKMENGRTTDWPTTKAALLIFIAGARTVDEVRRLQRDSEPTLNGLKGAYVGLYDEVIDAIQKRIAELEGGG